MKIPKSIHIKDIEAEKIGNIAEKINKERKEKGKEPLKISIIIHEIINKGLFEMEKKSN